MTRVSELMWSSCGTLESVWTTPTPTPLNSCWALEVFHFSPVTTIKSQTVHGSKSPAKSDQTSWRNSLGSLRKDLSMMMELLLVEISKATSSGSWASYVRITWIGMTRSWSDERSSCNWGYSLRLFCFGKWINEIEELANLRVWEGVNAVLTESSIWRDNGSIFLVWELIDLWRRDLEMRCIAEETDY
jgi:hypothetical protein